MTDNLEQRARELLAAQAHDLLCPERTSCGYCNCYTRRALRAIESALKGQPASSGWEGMFQSRVQPWMMECFGPEISADRVERCDRFIEEALELVQASGYDRERAHALVEYVYGRDQGEINQEVGGVMVTLAAHCLAFGVDMHEAGETELARISDPETTVKIRAKQAAKPKHSPLPSSPLEPAAPELGHE